ncbi:MAG TPA: heparinase II/III family protein [Chthonomonadaceae bacterium]|nr:heparinase II/III family protein [Chthonomonadaceae bacterium]
MPLLGWLCLAAAPKVVAHAGEINLARLPGVVAVVDSEHRDRWGIDGYHAACLNDGIVSGSETQEWMSDNWEVTHTAALVFPQAVRVQKVTFHWGNSLTPRRATLEGWHDGQWRALAALKTRADAPTTTLTLALTTVDAVRLVQPPDGANPRADRRLRIGEMEVFGETVGPKHDAVKFAAQLQAELKQQRQREDAARVKPALDLVMRRRKPRGFLGIINAEDVKRGRENVATRPWAKALADSIIKDADWWVAQDDSYIRSLVPEGNPRAICPQFEKGCPLHGGGRYSFDTTMETPYRWRCKKGGEWWYDGAVVKNPKTGKDVVVRDDGSGWLAPEGFPNAGRRYFFVAAYRYYLLGKLFSYPYEPDSGASKYEGGTPVTQLALAYALTGDKRYAHKAAVMLSRLADLYPHYDGCIEGPTQRQDGYIGQTFERFLVQNLILACDCIWDTLDDKQRDHIQRDLLGYVYEYLHRLMPYFDGDFIMYEMTALAGLASILQNPDMMQEVLEGDTGLRVMLTNSWFRDGKFIYDSCGYNIGNAQTGILIGEWLYGATAPPRYPRPLDPYNQPDYRLNALYDFLRHVDCDGRVPPIGDGGSGRGKALRTTPPYSRDDERALLRLPAERDIYTAQLQAASGGDLENYRNGNADWWLLFHAQEPLPKLAAPPQAPPQTSHLFPDSGIAILRAGESPLTRQHVILTFSKGSYGHGHRDKLAINLFRYGYDLTADIGYPSTWTDIKTGGWDTNTASHCTVMLDEKAQSGDSIGELDYYATQPMADVVEASAEKAAYPDASLYRRTVALVRDEAGEPLYTFDVFRVAGAKTRDYLFHSLGRPEDLNITLHDSAAQWQAQSKGSLAGENVEPMTQGGYGFLYDVQRAPLAAGGVAVWRSHSGAEQGDNYLLTRQTYRDFTVEFTMTRTGKASGSNERAFFVFGADAANPQRRRSVGLDSGEMPVGKPVHVRIEVRGDRVTTTLDGKPVERKVDSFGAPLEAGNVGFLHYYNFAYDYRDFTLTPQDGGPALTPDFTRPLDPQVWRIDTAYRTADGALQARDGDEVGCALHLLGGPGREIIRAKAEGPGVRGQSPLEGHVIVRDRATDPAAGSAFVAAMEGFQEAPKITALDAMTLTPSADVTPDGRAHLNAVAVRIKAGDRVDYLLSALDAVPRVAELDGVRIEFGGRFGLVTTRGGQVTSLTCVGGALACGEKRVEAPPTLRGEIVRTDIEKNALVIRVADRRMQPIVGAPLLAHNPRFVTPAVYSVQKAELLGDDLWRVELDMPLTLARGRVQSADAVKGCFASQTPVMKLRVNRGLFDGKRVRARLANDAPEFALTTATEEAFQLAHAQDVRAFSRGGEYVVLDTGAGDTVEQIGSAHR